MTVIYDELTDFSIKGRQFTRDARLLMSEQCGVPYEEVPDFIKQMVVSSLQKYGVIREAFLPYLKNWTWDRLPLLTQAILVMSYDHFYFVEKCDKVVVIDIAVTLAKRYIDPKQGQFVNAILDGVLK